MLDDLFSTIVLSYLCIFVVISVGSYLLPVGETVNKWLGMSMYAMTLPEPFYKVFGFNLFCIGLCYFLSLPETTYMFMWNLLLSVLAQLINRTELIETRRLRLLAAFVNDQSD